MWLFFLSLFAVTNATKLCVNCKHYVPSNGGPKCQLFPKYMDFSLKNIIIKRTRLVHYLVSGVSADPERDINYLNCTTARSIECMCGIEGKLYEDAWTIMK